MKTVPIPRAGSPENAPLPGQIERQTFLTIMKTRWLPTAALLVLISHASAQINTNLAPGEVATPVLAAAPRAVVTVDREQEARFRANSLSNELSQAGIVRTGASIELVPGGARADFGLLKVTFPADIGDVVPVRVTTAEGRQLSFRPTFLALRDTVTGESRLLGQVTNAVGLVVGTNWVIYTNAFAGIQADLRYRYRGDAGGHSLEQDVLLHENPAAPAAFLPANARLEVWTEWATPQAPRKELQALNLRSTVPEAAPEPALMADENLVFGSARIGAGNAFSARNENDRVPVGKTWGRIDDRDWLVETVDYLALKTKLQALPVRQAALPQGSRSYRQPAELIRSLHEPVKAEDRAMWLVQVAPALGDAVVLDFTIVSSVPVPSGIVSWWPAGGTGNDAIGSNHGYLSNGVTYAAGVVGQAFSYGTSTNYVKINNATSLNPTNGLTLDAWVYYPSSKSGVNMPIVSKDASGARQYLLTKTTANQLRAHVGITNNGFYYVDSPTALAADTWYHVAMTYSATYSNLSIYINGVLDTNATVVGALKYTTQPLYIGGAPPWSYYWNGGIDEVDLFDRALDASELLAIYNAGVAGKYNPNCVTAPTNIVAWWPGDTNTYDLARTNFATLSGATYAAAEVSSGFALDGVDDAVTAADDAAYNLGASDNLTIELWVKAESNTNDSGIMTVVSKRDASNPSHPKGYELYLGSGVPGFQIANGTSYANFSATSDIRGGYHHLAVTLDRSATNGGHIYVDGSSVLTFNPTVLTGSLSNTASVLLGKHPQSGFNGYYKGILDEVSLYRRALSSTEISALYAAGGAGKCKVDTDGDGLTDLQEAFLGTDPNDADSDDDGVTDGLEYWQGRNPLVAGAVADGSNQIGFQVYTPWK